MSTASPARCIPGMDRRWRVRGQQLHHSYSCLQLQLTQFPFEAGACRCDRPYRRTLGCQAESLMSLRQATCTAFLPIMSASSGFARHCFRRSLSSSVCCLRYFSLCVEPRVSTSKAKVAVQALCGRREQHEPAELLRCGPGFRGSRGLAGGDHSRQCGRVPLPGEHKRRPTQVLVAPPFHVVVRATCAASQVLHSSLS